MKELQRFVRESLLKAGVTPLHAEKVADVFERATLRGVGHHDIYDLPGRLQNLTSKRINPKPHIQQLSKFEAIESYDGDNGLGEIGSSFITDRAMNLASQYGIGFCTIRHSNHFLAASPYVERAAEAGFLGLIFTRTRPAMNVPGINSNVIGNNPMGFAAVTGKEFPLMLDIAMAYTSNGKLNQMIQDEQPIPIFWGKDAQGNPTEDPVAVKNGGSINPIAEHKGFGLSLLVEMLTGLLSGGEVIDEEHPERGGVGVHSQAALIIKIEGFMDAELFRKRSSEMIDRLAANHREIRIPGQRSHKNKLQIEREGIELSPVLVRELDRWAEQLQISPLER
jgi:LDH2 family malate/lactate/ureidoglycolate dehydrogenase